MFHVKRLRFQVMNAPVPGVNLRSCATPLSFHVKHRELPRRPLAHRCVDTPAGPKPFQRGCRDHSVIGSLLPTARQQFALTSRGGRRASFVVQPIPSRATTTQVSAAAITRAIYCRSRLRALEAVTDCEPTRIGESSGTKSHDVPLGVETIPCLGAPADLWA